MMRSLFICLVGGVWSAPQINSYDDIESTAICGYGVDVFFLQDTTGSFMDDMPYTRAQLPNLIKTVNTMFPGSRTGLAEFRDKPFYPLGEETDFCYKKHAYGSLTSVSEETEWAYSILQPSGGGDLPEDHYQAIVNSILDSSVGWRSIVNSNDQLSEQIRSDSDVVTEEVAARIIVVITDASPHYNGQMKLYPPSSAHPDWKVPQNLPANEGTVIGGNLTAACVSRDYLEPTKFSQVVSANKFTLIVMHTDDVANVWEWINESLLNQPRQFRRTIDDLSSNLMPELIEAIKAVGDYECPVSPSTTAPTTTTTATTPVPATTPTTTTIPETTATTTTTPPTTPVVAPTTTTTTLPETTTTTTTTLPTSMTTAVPTTTTTVATVPQSSTGVDTSLTQTTAVTEAVSDCVPVHECDGPCDYRDGVLIKIKERPRHMVLEIVNDE